MKKEKLFTVYLHRSPSNKYYVGITSSSLIKRWHLDGSGYMDNIGEFNDANSFVDVDLSKDAANPNNLKSSGNFTSVGIGCSNINRVYTP